VPSLLSPADVAAVKRLRRDGFATARAVADPSTDLVLDRGGIELAPQEVLVDWVGRRASRSVGGATAMRETDADVVFRRPEPFDAAAGDRFRLQNGPLGIGTTPTGEITRVYRDAGLVYAEATLDVGSA
jgi:hypothetical protein